MKKIILCIFANLALMTTEKNLRLCTWIMYQEKLPENVEKLLAKRHE